MKNLPSKNLAKFISNIKDLIKNARYNAFTAINIEMLKTYFEIGRKIVEEEQGGSKRAEYGKRLLETLSHELLKEFDKGYSVTALRNMRTFYILYKDTL